VVAHDEFLDAIQTPQHLKRVLSEKNVTEMPNSIVLAHCGIPTVYKFVVVFFDGGEGPVLLLKVDNFLVSEVGI
jgi:hypothetical protein